jgi:UDP-glucuronate 4-epimerase
MRKKILITGCAGFIGFHLSKKLSKKFNVVGVDNLNSYYDVKLKKDRLKILKKIKNFKFYKNDISNFNEVKKIFNNNKFDSVINLAAQAGVRYSLENPFSYINTNIIGFFNIIENCKIFNVKRLLYASTSSVYGNQTKFPIKENFDTSSPIQLYAATKKSNELIAHSYSYLYKIKTVGLRFFTVYGPWGRPDMALFKFTKNILENKPIEIFNYGKHTRDFTYIDDIIEGIEKCLLHNKSKINFNVLNLGNSKPIKLIEFIKIIEKNLNKESKKKFLSIQKGDVFKTHSSIKKANNEVNFFPKTNHKLGIKKFISWFKTYYKLDN